MRLPCLLALALLAPAPALGVPIQVGFSGVIDGVAGSVPGDPAPGAGFTGALSYDSDQLPSIVSGPQAFYDFAPGSASLRVRAAGESYGDRPTGIRIVITNDAIVDRDTGQIVPPNDPNAAGLDAFGMSNPAPSIVDEWLVLLEYSDLVPGGLSDLFDSLDLPEPSATVASQLVGGEVEVRFQDASGDGFTGTITDAFVIPEPATGLLLALGVALLPALGRRDAAAGAADRGSRAQSPV